MGSYTAWIFTLGTELTQGRIINTNAAFIGRRLTLLGFNVLGVITLVDDVDLISRFISQILSEKPRVIVTTGGLGPTHDDRTLEAVAKAINRKLILNQEAFEMVKKKYESKGLELTPERVKMAYLPEGGVPIPNPVGTAPGCWLEVEGTVIISLPGVPKEMESMWITWVEPRLKPWGPGLSIVEKLIVVVGVPESSIAPVLKAVLKQYSEVYIKSHPEISEAGEPVLKIYIMYSHRDEKAARDIVENVLKSIEAKYREIYGRELKIVEVRDTGELSA
jgi:molybdenum cofactor synthesis domain-containing protein